jgi:hypothetical protein
VCAGTPVHYEQRPCLHARVFLGRRAAGSLRTTTRTEIGAWLILNANYYTNTWTQFVVGY